MAKTPVSAGSIRGPNVVVASVNYAATITPNAGTANDQRVTATGNLAVNLPSGGTDGQYVLLWVYASGADRTVTMASGYGTTQAVPGRVVVIPSGTWGSVLVRNRGGTWVLMAAQPQTQVATLGVNYAAALSLDCTASSAFAVTATGNITGISITGTPVDGQRLFLEVYASGTRTVTTALSNMSGQTLPISVASGKLGLLGFYYSARANRWVLSYAYPEP